MNHYFLVASLPLLRFGEKPSLTLEAFLAACAANLSAEETAVARDLVKTDGIAGSHPFSIAWLDRETEIRNTIARSRAHTRRTSPDAWVRPQQGARVFIQKGVAEAFLLPNPLERERALDQLRWTILDELAGLNPFGIEAVFAYGLRLRIAWRWGSFNQEAGMALLEKTVSEIAGKTARKNGLTSKLQQAAST